MEPASSPSSTMMQPLHPHPRERHHPLRVNTGPGERTGTTSRGENERPSTLPAPQPKSERETGREAVASTVRVRPDPAAAARRLSGHRQAAGHLLELSAGCHNEPRLGIDLPGCRAWLVLSDSIRVHRARPRPCLERRELTRRWNHDACTLGRQQRVGRRPRRSRRRRSERARADGSASSWPRGWSLWTIVVIVC